MIYWPAKAPGEVVDYVFDWSSALEEGETITAKTVAGEGVTVQSSTIEGGLVRVWLEGGAEGTVATVTGSIETSETRLFDEVAIVTIGSTPVSLSSAKDYLKVETDTEDGLICGLLAAAVGSVEAQIGRNFTPKVEHQFADGFPCRMPYGLRLRRGPVQEILALEYDDGDGVATALADYRLVEGRNEQLLPAYGESWPATIDGPSTVRVDYLAGYAPGERPRELEQAVLMLVAHWYQNREAVSASASISELPLAVKMLIGPYRPSGLA